MPAPQLLRKTLMFLVVYSAYTGAVFAASTDSTPLNEKISRVEQRKPLLDGDVNNQLRSWLLPDNALLRCLRRQRLN